MVQKARDERLGVRIRAREAESAWVKTGRLLLQGLPNTRCSGPALAPLASIIR